ncbi:Flp pilus assembly protein CpaB [Vibrio owensii]|uniref:Flp pilus assembly protein CpaB n=1 Tax=Vibrio owensii TaxID=696485 RepID=UPI00105204F9|nr:Flp pilus assembly protein CpaB [Vibrio owensii]TDE26256.1 Flp pilus assembly protein CpaB [Vibrio owensii]
MKKLLLIGIGGLAILLGLYGLASNLSQPANTPKQVKVEQGPQLIVWRLKTDVNSGQKVAREHFELERIPEDKAHSLGVDKDMTLEFTPGAIYPNSLKAGELAFDERIIDPDEDGYVDLVLADNRVPYAIKVRPESIIGGVISHDTLIDVLSLSLPTEFSIETADTEASRKRNMFVTPILTGIKVLQVKTFTVEGARNQAPKTEVNVILELTRKQVATITVARRISELEIHKSIGEYEKSDLHADAGDVLSNFKSVVEFRSNTVNIN